MKLQSASRTGGAFLLCPSPLLAMKRRTGGTGTGKKDARVRSALSYATIRGAVGQQCCVPVPSLCQCPPTMLKIAVSGQ